MTASTAAWYRLDAQDRIVAVDPSWDEFALANAGVGACASRVIGRPLLDFVLGDPTRMLLEAGLMATRMTGRPRSIAYRCDAPDLRRDLVMTLTPTPDGGVLVEHHLTSAQPRALAVHVQPSGHPTASGWWRCSQCQRLSAPGAHQPAVWLDSGTPLPANSAGLPLTVHEVVCDACVQRHQAVHHPPERP